MSITRRARRRLPPRFDRQSRQPVREPQATTWEARLTQARDLAGTLALLAVPVFALRAWIVGSFDFSVASALMLHTTPAQLVYASLLFMLPVFLTLLAVLVARWVCRAAIQKRWHPVLVFVSPFAALPIFLIPITTGSERGDWSTLVFLVGATPVLATYDLMEEHFGGRDAKALRVGLLRFVVIALAVILTGAFALWPKMWLPPERAVVSGAAKKIYILDRKDGEYVIFDPRTKSVLRVPGGNVQDRQYCEDPKEVDYLIHAVISKPKGRPECP
ncbi:hypothetical protein [Micromonospora arida]